MATKETFSRQQALRNVLRQEFREKRRALSLSEQSQAAQGLIEKFKTCPLFAEARKVGLYLTHDGELDTKPLIQSMWDMDIDVYLPVLHPFCSGHLLFIQYSDKTPMKINRYGIYEPELDCSAVSPTTELDIMFVPLVAFDDEGNRLGMGGGFYDRTLVSIIDSKMINKTKGNNNRTKVVGLAHEIQHTQNLPKQVWDIPLPYVLTPTQLYEFYLKGLKSESVKPR